VSEIKFLADVNVEKPIVEYLSKQGYDIKWIPDYDCEMFDEELLQMANEEQRILITNDKGFGDLVIMQKRLSAGAILFRVKGQGAQEKVQLMRKLLMGYRDKLLNHYVIISKSKIRVIPLGDRK
jgi:predicted nuclease of predicted toxin-antitoxin system